ncbi:DUF397 domain-containing protein [Saccharopolyspora sp. TS4A08]|uniref:DUF397 domain-containing protein n=1 Tax=Saccharopolyspora ipomoeae TaxID=3042027 RepID=A0ABT6PWA4_9PSEU|nr:DUF397 domain-containing protein [Saccharopolyspora sp. TS4A08]MDI2032293.1 DUF397 domain-containing protein [Saccharopolyspora sp. TS4A08]
MTTLPTFAQDDFHKATASHADKECVRVARRDGWVELRDDKKSFGATDDLRIRFTEEQFDAFLVGVRSGNVGGLCLAMTARSDGTYTLRSTITPTPGPELEFTEAEVAAFLDGVARGEFDRDVMSQLMSA